MMFLRPQHELLCSPLRRGKVVDAVLFYELDLIQVASLTPNSHTYPLLEELGTI